MRKIILAIVLLLAVTLVFGGYSSAATFPQSDEFTIGLASNPTTGYDWYASFDTKRLELVERWYVSDDDGVVISRQGVGGTSYFKFNVKTTRWATVTFVYKRAWEDAVLDKKIFRVKG